jgi:tartrate dehydratase beta subunit/fumarate hydratase class I family protein
VTTGGGVTILTGSHVMIINKMIWEDRGEETMKTIKVKGMSCDHCVMVVIEEKIRKAGFDVG